jgi:hypothetical protein
MKKKPGRRMSDVGSPQANLALLCGGISPHVLPLMKPPDRFSATDYSRPLHDKSFSDFQLTYLRLDMSPTAITAQTPCLNCRGKGSPSGVGLRSVR